VASDNDNTNTINQRELWDESEPPLLRSEIEMAIKILRNHKASGSDDIVVEMIKATTEKGVLKEMGVPEHLIAIIKMIYTNGQA